MGVGFADGAPPITVAALIATRGRPALLGQAVRSIAAQTRPPEALVVVNDGGAAGDVVAARMAARLPATAVRVARLSPGAGHVRARNAGLALVEESHVAILDDDDLWLPDHLAGLVAALAAGAALAYADAEVVTVDRRAQPARVLARQPFSLPWDDALARRYNLVVPSGMAYARALHGEVGPFDARAGHHWDWDFVLAVAGAGHRPARVPAATVLYSIDAAGRNESARTDEMRRSVARLAGARGLATDRPHTFGTMLEEPDVRAHLAPTRRDWDGRWPPRRRRPG